MLKTPLELRQIETKGLALPMLHGWPVERIVLEKKQTRSSDTSKWFSTSVPVLVALSSRNLALCLGWAGGSFGWVLFGQEDPARTNKWWTSRWPKTTERKVARGGGGGNPRAKYVWPWLGWTRMTLSFFQGEKTAQRDNMHPSSVGHVPRCSKNFYNNGIIQEISNRT